MFYRCITLIFLELNGLIYHCHKSVVFKQSWNYNYFQQKKYMYKVLQEVMWYLSLKLDAKNTSTVCIHELKYANCFMQCLSYPGCNMSFTDQWSVMKYQLTLYRPTLTKGSNWQITQIWESDVFRLGLEYSTSIPSLEQKHSSCWKIFRSRYNDIALMSMYMTDAFCSFTRNVIF